MKFSLLHPSPVPELMSLLFYGAIWQALQSEYLQDPRVGQLLNGTYSMAHALPGGRSVHFRNLQTCIVSKHVNNTATCQISWTVRCWTVSSWTDTSWTVSSWTVRSWTDRSWTVRCWIDTSWTVKSWEGASSSSRFTRLLV
jgi:hypothetical protein